MVKAENDLLGDTADYVPGTALFSVELGAPA